jgi:predicted O-methyltransferase YrrM
MQSPTIKNLTANALRGGFLPVMMEKLWLRLTERNRRAEEAQSAEWCAEHAEALDAFASALDPSAWAEAIEFDTALGKHAEEKLAAIDVDLGGGGDCRLLHFLVRHLKPQTMVETGVAAGFSSQCILSAMAKNELGHLYSSDFPYFRLERPEQYVGYLVDDDLKSRWTLHIEGDRKNLPKIVAEAGKIDLLHYDSDKSRSGRSMAMKLLKPHLKSNAPIVMDDIQDNLFFRDFARGQSRTWRVFRSKNKFVGLIGL